MHAAPLPPLPAARAPPRPRRPTPPAHARRLRRAARACSAADAAPCWCAAARPLPRRACSRGSCAPGGGLLRPACPAPQQVPTALCRRHAASALTGHLLGHAALHVATLGPRGQVPGIVGTPRRAEPRGATPQGHLAPPNLSCRRAHPPIFEVPRGSRGPPSRCHGPIRVIQSLGGSLRASGTKGGGRARRSVGGGRRGVGTARLISRDFLSDIHPT